MFNNIKSMKTNNYFYLKKFQKEMNIGFFSSNGGVSKGNYFSLNCSKSSQDKKINVNKNIEISRKNLGIIDKELILINQKHSAKIHKITIKNFRSSLFGDGLFTKNKNFALGVLTADCAPIFLFDAKKKFICCIHSGWKGALKNIASKGISLFEKEYIKKKDIIVLIGPCLSKSNFEVDKKFKINFLKKNRSYASFFKFKNDSKDNFDLRGLLNFQFKSLGIKNIYNLRKNTYSNKHIFFSHRRATHEKYGETGRMINIISFKD